MSECVPAELRSLALRLLGEIERREAVWLTWGLPDRYLRSVDVEDAADVVLAGCNASYRARDLFDYLRERHLLLSLPGPDGARIYRSRLGEGVRLFARLRQLFPGRHWAESPELVADYRITVRPRCYPRRAIGPSTVLERLDPEGKMPSIERAALQALLVRDGVAVQLADFQLDATDKLLRTFGRGSYGALMVCAGTGSGKTLAFYLPALTRVLAGARPSPQFFTQAIAIYPRNELLKDQFTEAYGQARALDAVARQHLRRPLRIGAFYGPTPHSVGGVEGEHWPRRGGGRVCPMMRCHRCGGDLIWRDADRSQNREVWTCQAEPSHRVSGDEVVMTRAGMQHAPPDLLFTTTEMMNRHLSDPQCYRLYGTGQAPERSPFTLLLDEVHSYAGTHGAHVATLLRRWSSRVRRPIQYVGLSATLTDPCSFLADMTGVPEPYVHLVTPDDDLVREGQEYQLLLRWNPASGTSVMSTTIQATMLMGRLLDPSGDLSGGVFPRRTFLFTDDLDVTNRLYHDLLDAEGRRGNGAPAANREALASLRASGGDESAARLAMGQNWYACAEIGHDLDAERLVVGRTSSQDRGVHAEANVVVATTALELGYNDPDVGAVLQHKAPLSAASFVQRRGRAGRRRQTRPWTVTVLSDYGRDRQAYEAYEALFSPTIPRPDLPVRNRYILKMQAVYAFMEWLSDRSGQSAWPVASSPSNGSRAERARLQVADIVRAVLDDPGIRDDLEDYLCRALNTTRHELSPVLWQPPRALFTAALPTLLRRLQANWRCLHHESEEALDLTTGGPLPDFVTSTLFGDLLVPEVEVAVTGKASESETYSMPVAQALSLVAPGRVTRRFAPHQTGLCHWVEPPSDGEVHGHLDVASFCLKWEELDISSLQLPGGGPCVAGLRYLRPYLLQMAETPEDVRASSNAFLHWQAAMHARPDSSVLPVPKFGALASLVREMRVLTHQQNCPAGVTRFAASAESTVQYESGDEQRQTVHFVDSQAGPVALGFYHEVDGIAFTCEVSSVTARAILANGGLRLCRVPYYRHLVACDEVLSAMYSSFQAERMADLTVGVLLELSRVDAASLSAAAERFVADGVLVGASRTVTGQLPTSTSDGEQDQDVDEGDGVDSTVPRSLRVIREGIADVGIRQRLADLATCLWDEPDDEFVEWTRLRLVNTLGTALLEACYQTAGRTRTSDLLIDIEATAGAGATTGHRIWITEETTGGVGVVEEIATRYAEDPGRFWALAEGALRPSDLELVDMAMARALALATDDGPVADAFAGLRCLEAEENPGPPIRQLMGALSEAGIPPTPATVRSLNTRLLRPGSSARSDRFVLDALRLWHEVEARLDVEIDQRVFCTLAGADSEVAGEARAIVGEVIGDDSAQVAARAVLDALMWPRGSRLRQSAIEAYSRFARGQDGDPKLLREWIDTQRTPFELDEGWRASFDKAIAADGVASVRCDQGHVERLSHALVSLTAEPVDLGYLRGYPVLLSVTRDAGGYVALFQVREALQ